MRKRRYIFPETAKLQDVIDVFQQAGVMEILSIRRETGLFIFEIMEEDKKK